MVVAEMIAGQEREPNGVVVGSRVMLIGVGGKLTPAVRQVGAEVKKLKRGQNGRKDLKRDEPFPGNSAPGMKRLRNERERDELKGGHVMREKIPEPAHPAQA